MSFFSSPEPLDELLLVDGPGVEVLLEEDREGRHLLVQHQTP